MRHLSTAMVAVVLLVVLAGGSGWGQITGGVNPPGNEQRSMGNLRPNMTAPGDAAVGRGPAGFTHRRYSYGNPPYYRRPPVRPYYVAPPYYGYDRGYGYYVYPWGGRPYYVPPRGYWYTPFPYRWW